MDPLLRSKLKSQLQLEEGYKQFVYADTRSVLTIGIGRNLEKDGISVDEALYLLENDIQKVWLNLVKYLPWVVNLDMVRQLVLCDMCFNLGINGLLQFQKMLDLAKVANFAEAAQEMLNSKWAEQVKDRAERLAHQMETGNF